MPRRGRAFRPPQLWAAAAATAAWPSEGRRLRAAGDGIGLATVYRTLQGLAEDGDMDVVRTGDGEQVYRRCSRGHHHHLLCRSCGRTVELDAATVERWAAGIGEQHGFTDVEHVVEIFGTCADCRAALRADDATPSDQNAP